jgi:hypothetical protein
MKKYMMIALATFIASTALAGGHMGGGSGLEKPSELIVGEQILEIPGGALNANGILAVKKDILDELLLGSIAKKSIQLNGEAVKAERFDFSAGSLHLRSEVDPTRILTIMESPAEAN